MKLGLLTSELFAPGLTGIGGFGWATRQVARLFSGEPALGVECVIVMARPVPAEATPPATLHGCRVLWRANSHTAHLRQLRAEKFDLLLAVDNHAIFRLFSWALPRTPVLFWIRDPWPPADKAAMATLRLPGDPTPPQGLWARDLRSFRWDWRASRAMGRRMLFGTPTRIAREKFAATYGFSPPRVADLPNPVVAGPGSSPTKTARPTVVILGRLDPVKRPWIAVEVARRMPAVEFLFLGQNHFRGPGAWAPDNLPPNVRLLGHTDGEAKTSTLAGAWALLNTSIHEGLPVTFQEALAVETPIVSCLDPEEVTTRFGIFTGEALGDGMELVPKFTAALTRLIADAPLRARLGAAGRAWVEATHSRETFLAAFRQLAREAGVTP
ncbi:MAG: hypothetical protein RLZZ15_900 [Verrucomicrobiota bacterium]|jgi:glycosyltransferase involved in cell wall biosynthesis